MRDKWKKKRQRRLKRLDINNAQNIIKLIYNLGTYKLIILLECN